MLTLKNLSTQDEGINLQVPDAFTENVMTQSSHWAKCFPVKVSFINSVDVAFIDLLAYVATYFSFIGTWYSNSILNLPNVFNL